MLSVDGNTLAVGANQESSNAIGIDGDQSNNFNAGAGAVYVFTRSASTWIQRSYVKASNTGSGYSFGFSLALSGDGKTLSVVAPFEYFGTTGINGSLYGSTALDAGAVNLY